MKRETIKIARYRSPLGEMTIGSFSGKLCVCDWNGGRHSDVGERRIRKALGAEYEDGISELILRAISELDEYFAGSRRVFDIPLLLTGSEFQNAVWTELLKIPYGTTVSYAALARLIRNPKAVRAVANANATNPISIFVPCHRVIGSDNSLTGYGGGLDVKRSLLALESPDLFR